jgi:hypothetical protein
MNEDVGLTIWSIEHLKFNNYYYKIKWKEPNIGIVSSDIELRHDMIQLTYYSDLMDHKKKLELVW